LERLRDENERLHVENRRLIDRLEVMGVPVGVGGSLTTTTTPPAAQREPAPGYCKHCKQYTIEEPLAAAQRQWVGLTDEEIDDADCVELEYIGSGDYVVNGESVYKFAIAIEAKLKEKNT
jgi:hypothetical protein